MGPRRANVGQPNVGGTGYEAAVTDAPQQPRGCDAALGIDDQIIALPIQRAALQKLERTAEPGLLDHLVEIVAWTLVGEHHVDLASILGEGAVIALPVTVAGHEQHEFRALLALDAALGLSCLCGFDDRG